MGNGGAELTSEGPPRLSSCCFQIGRKRMASTSTWSSGGRSQMSSNCRGALHITKPSSSLQQTCTWAAKAVIQGIEERLGSACTVCSFPHACSRPVSICTSTDRCCSLKTHVSKGQHLSMAASMHTTCDFEYRLWSVPAGTVLPLPYIGRAGVASESTKGRGIDP